MSRLHRPKAGFWIRLCVIVLYPLNGLLFRIRWVRLDRIPADGGVILAVNHISYADTIFMARFVWQSGRIPRFLIKGGIFHRPLIGRVMRGAGQIPVHRGTSDAAQSLRDAQAALERGECVIIYPEGTLTRDPDQWPMAGKTGIARLALMVPDIPVIPVGQWGPQLVLDTRRRRFRPFARPRAVAAVGDAVDLTAFRGEEPTAELLRTMTGQVMDAITGLVAEARGVPRPDAASPAA
jgi:1-acyl-sn-glycerol-3-phosphate acyltransferase